MERMEVELPSPGVPAIDDCVEADPLLDDFGEGAAAAAPAPEPEFPDYAAMDVDDDGDDDAGEMFVADQAPIAGHMTLRPRRKKPSLLNYDPSVVYGKRK